MSLLDWIFGRDKQSSSPPPSDDYWYQPVGAYNSAGVRVTHDTAMRVAAVNSCVRVLAESIASLPISVYQRQADGGKQEMPDHPLYQLLKYQPNAFQTKFNFIQMLIGHQALRGNFYAEKIINPLGQVEALIPLHPGRMQTEQLRDYSLRFTYASDTGQQIKYLQGEIFRVHSLSCDGIKGQSVIEQAADTFGGAMQTQTYANSFFANNAQPGGILKSTAPMDESTRKANKEQWESRHRGAKNAGKVAILSGLEWQAMGMTNTDSQFLESRKFTRSEICGLFGVPPHMIGDLDRATFSNIEHQDIAFYKHTIRPWLVNIEQSIKRDLVMEPDVFVEFNVDGLLRGDALTRNQVYSIALGSGGHQPYMTVNEVRAKENLNPVEGGDVLPEPPGQSNQSGGQQNDSNNQPKGNPDGKQAHSVAGVFLPNPLAHSRQLSEGDGEPITVSNGNGQTAGKN